MKISINGWLRAAFASLAVVFAHGTLAYAADPTEIQGAGSALVSVLPSVGDNQSPFKEVPANAAPADAGMADVQGTSEYDDCGIDSYSGAPGRIWFRGDFVHWWTRGQHVPPLVSTITDLNNPNGTLQTVFGDRTVEGGGHDGFDINVGAWLDCDHMWGVSISYLDLAQKSDNYDSGFTNGFQDGLPFPIVRPFFDPAVGVGIQSNGVGVPNQDAGRVTVTTNDYFQMAAATVHRALYSREWTECGRDVNWLDASARTLRVDGLVGYRYARLSDSVQAQDDEIDVNAASPTYLNTFQFIDRYRSRTDFNGGEIGLDITATRGRWSLQTIAKAAIGDNRQYVQEYGLVRRDLSNVQLPPGNVLQAEQTSEFTRDRFSMIPQLTLNAGYNVTNYLKLTAGYDIMYWSHVVRAGDQIAVNPASGLPYGSLIGTTLPGFAWQDNYFWAQGFRVGGELRY